MCPTFPLPGPSVARSTREDKERIPRRAYVPIVTSEEILEIQGGKIGIMFEIAKMEMSKETKEQPPKETPGKVPSCIRKNYIVIYSGTSEAECFGSQTLKNQK
ncbi:Hypothetical predicted protein [Podarcis lilfordi]|uniref:Uncharacterized protein n=1 Tax=Podarcis lilfordi TaxID=74358 RepID=A0AA35NUA5_9SAUR|nr:Hypothetical predicted protein [Podarcis lilfordi]